MTNQTKIRIKKKELNTMLTPSYKNVTRQIDGPPDKSIQSGKKLA